MAIWIIDKFIQLHASIAGNVERRSIDEYNAECAIRVSLDHVPQIDWIIGLRLTNAVSWQIGLNNDRALMFDGRRPRRVYHLPDWL